MTYHIIQQQMEGQQSNQDQGIHKRVRSLTLEEVQEAMRDEKQQIKQPSLKLHSSCLREGCEQIDNYHRLNKIHEGQYGVVYRARELPTNKVFAIKKLKMKEGDDFPITSLRQISILRSLDHPNIINISRVAGSGKRDKVYIVMQYLEHQIKELLKSIKFNEQQIRRLMKDLLDAMAYLHERKIVHRDLKTSNLLYSNEGILKICDFGLARKAAQALMTQEVITMWYRPPELLLDKYHYSTQLDMWSVGCIMAQFFIRQPLFQGKTEIQQLDTIFKIVGSPTEETWPKIKDLKNYLYVSGKKFPVGQLPDIFASAQTKVSPEGLQLMKSLLTANPTKRLSAKKALQHPWLKGEMSVREQMPKMQPMNELDRVTHKKLKIASGI